MGSYFTILNDNPIMAATWTTIGQVRCPYSLPVHESALFYNFVYTYQTQCQKRCIDILAGDCGYVAVQTGSTMPKCLIFTAADACHESEFVTNSGWTYYQQRGFKGDPIWVHCGVAWDWVIGSIIAALAVIAVVASLGAALAPAAATVGVAAGGAAATATVVGGTTVAVGGTAVAAGVAVPAISAATFLTVTGSVAGILGAAGGMAALAVENDMENFDGAVKLHDEYTEALRDYVRVDAGGRKQYGKYTLSLVQQCTVVHNDGSVSKRKAWTGPTDNSNHDYPISQYYPKRRMEGVDGPRDTWVMSSSAEDPEVNVIDYLIGQSWTGTHCTEASDKCKECTRCVTCLEADAQVEGHECSHCGMECQHCYKEMPCVLDEEFYDKCDGLQDQGEDIIDCVLDCQECAHAPDGDCTECNTDKCKTRLRSAARCLLNQAVKMPKRQDEMNNKAKQGKGEDSAQKIRELLKFLNKN